MIKHNHAINGKPTATYNSWCGMKQRCNNPNFTTFKNYGGRGIKLCERWNEFKNFLEDMGERPEEKTLDRINNNGNYNKENCKWATRKEQSSNMRSNVYLTFYGKKRTVAEWCRKVGIKQDIFCKRRSMGWSIKECLWGKKQINFNKLEIPKNRKEGVKYLRKHKITFERIADYYGVSKQRIHQIYKT